MEGMWGRLSIVGLDTPRFRSESCANAVSICTGISIPVPVLTLVGIPSPVLLLFLLSLFQYVSKSLALLCSPPGTLLRVRARPITPSLSPSLPSPHKPPAKRVKRAHKRAKGAAKGVGKKARGKGTGQWEKRQGIT